MLNGKQLLDLSKDWDLTDESGVLVFTDFLEERGEPEIANCLREVVKYVRKNPSRQWTTAGEWLKCVSGTGKLYMGWLCEHWTKDINWMYENPPPNHYE